MHQSLPLFPLGTVLVPGLVMPLHIFEPRYRGLVRDLLDIDDEDQREFGIIAARPGRSIERDGRAALFDVGTSAVLRQAEELEDGRFDIVTTGSRRFRLLDIDASNPLVMGAVEFLEESDGEDVDARAAFASRRFEQYRSLLAAEVPEDAPDLPSDPSTLSYLVTAAMILPLDERQLLLSAPDAATRLRLACTLLDRENLLIPALSSVPAVDLIGPEAMAN